MLYLGGKEKREKRTIINQKDYKERAVNNDKLSRDGNNRVVSVFLSLRVIRSLATGAREREHARERQRERAREREQHDRERGRERESSTRVVSEHQMSRSEERVHARAHNHRSLLAIKQ
jgi:hypothetical protein